MLVLLEEGVNVDLQLISFNMFSLLILDDLKVHPENTFTP